MARTGGGVVATGGGVVVTGGGVVVTGGEVGSASATRFIVSEVTALVLCCGVRGEAALAGGRRETAVLMHTQWDGRL